MPYSRLRTPFATGSLSGANRPGFKAVQKAIVQVQRYDVPTVDKRIKLVDVAQVSSSSSSSSSNVGLRSFDAVLRFRLLKVNTDKWLSNLVLTVMQSRLVDLHVEAVAMGKESDCADVLKGAGEHPQADALAQAQHDVRHRDNVIQVLTQRVQSLEVENTQLRSACTAKDHTIATLEQENAQLKSRVEQQDAIIDDLRKRNVDLKTQVDQLQLLVKHLSQKVEDLMAEVNQLKLQRI